MSKTKINNETKQNVKGFKNKYTIDDILGTYNQDDNKDNNKDNTQVNKLKKQNEMNNQTKKDTTLSSKSNNENDEKNTNITHITPINTLIETSNETNTNIDHLLNNETFNFENKQQKSMFFVDYKSIDILLSTLKSKCNFTVPKEIVDEHIMTHIPTIIKEYTSNLKKRCKKVINTEYICLGRKLDNKQCTRKKHNGTEFCKSHLIKLSNGRIDEPTPTVVHNKRGRKRKVEFDPRQYDNAYITLWEDIINGEKVLLDSNNNIYTYDLKSPKFIGKKTINTKIDLLLLNKQKEEQLEEKSEAQSEL